MGKAGVQIVFILATTVQAKQVVLLAAQLVEKE